MPARRSCTTSCGRLTTAKDGVCGTCKQAIRQQKLLVPCKRCGEPRDKPSGKYCANCEGLVKSELYAAGYLQKVPKPTTSRPFEAREVVSETKFGKGHG